MTTLAERTPLNAAASGFSRERKTALKYCAVSLMGFIVDAAILRAGLMFGAPAWVRIISLICTMQVTFTLNGLVVFRTLTWRTLPRQWSSYMLTNGFGNFCNYWIFVTLVSLHKPFISDPMIALGVGAFAAWMINFLCARFVVFGKVKELVEVAREWRREPEE
jgi:putative flippase GtrA